MPFVFGKAFIYDPKSGELSTVPEFGSVPLGNIGKHLSQKEVQAAIRELGRVIDEDRRSGEEGPFPSNTPGEQIDYTLQLISSAYYRILESPQSPLAVNR